MDRHEFSVIAHRDHDGDLRWGHGTLGIRCYLLLRP